MVSQVGPTYGERERWEGGTRSAGSDTARQPHGVKGWDAQIEQARTMHLATHASMQLKDRLKAAVKGVPRKRLTKCLGFDMLQRRPNDLEGLRGSPPSPAPRARRAKCPPPGVRFHGRLVEGSWKTRRGSLRSGASCVCTHRHCHLHIVLSEFAFVPLGHDTHCNQPISGCIVFGLHFTHFVMVDALELARTPNPGAHTQLPATSMYLCGVRRDVGRARQRRDEARPSMWQRAAGVACSLVLHATSCNPRPTGCRG